MRNTSGENMKYFVVYERDRETEQHKKYGELQLYDKIKYFEGEEHAKEFALEHYPVLMGKQSVEQANNYVVAVEHEGKYKHYCYDGSCDSLTTYDARHCTREELEKTVDAMMSEKTAKKAIIGIELKLW
jgi:hypothetical protein